ncbi:MAG: HPr family phosphocarrier protein [Bacilli bacterium]|nr:HPr family phosphocarrier protein [Bacilli bacterium]
MKQFSYVITDKEGIHARPAGVVVAEAKKYASNFKIENKGKSADLKRIFGVMSLCVKCGEEIVVTVEGADEEAAAAAVEKVFKENL